MYQLSFQVVQHVFSNLITLYDVMESLGADTYNNKRGLRKHRAWSSAIHQFQSAVKQDPLMSQLFTYAVCSSGDVMHQHLMEILQIKAQQGTQNAAEESAAKQPPPGTGMLCCSVCCVLPFEL